jgi:hypothetical protein
MRHDRGTCTCTCALSTPYPLIGKGLPRQPPPMPLLHCDCDAMPTRQALAVLGYPSNFAPLPSGLTQASCQFALASTITKVSDSIAI